MTAATTVNATSATSATARAGVEALGFAARLIGRARSAAGAVRAKAGEVSEGRWNTLIIAGFLLVVGSMVCTKVIEEDAAASTKLQPLAGVSTSKWRGGVRAVQADDRVEMEVVESASPFWHGANLRTMEVWVVDQEGVGGVGGAGGVGGLRDARQMQSM
jgi:hypothetical protein